MEAMKLYLDSQKEEKQALALCRESKVILALGEPMGKILEIPLILLIKSLPSLTECKIPILLFSVDEIMT